MEHIDDVQVQSQGGADVIGFAAIHDLLEVVEHVSAENHNGQHRNGHHAGAGAHKHVDQAAHHQDNCANKQPFAHARQIALDNGSQTGHDKKHTSGAAKCSHHQLSAVAETQHHGNQAREHESHKEGKSQQDRHACSRVFVLFNRVNEAKSTG